MKNYESIAYTSDFLSGNTVVQKKMKQDKGIKGKVTVSLFDTNTKEKIKESYTENLIPDLYFKDCFLSHFLSGIMGVGSGRYTSNFNWFNYIYLTDSDKPENPNEQRIMGNIIGFAHRNTTYSGSSSLQGTINHSETKFEVLDNKARLNFVFDFPTHTANGVTESIYFCYSDPAHKDYFHLGAPLFGREIGDNDYSIDSASNPRRYYGMRYGFDYGTVRQFTDITKGFFLLDCKNTSITQTSYLTFPESLKEHWVLMPFDVNINDCMLWESAVKLLNEDGEPLILVDTDPVKMYDGLTYASPHRTSTGEDIIIGYYHYTRRVNSVYCDFLRIYTWSKVGVLQQFADVNVSEVLIDEYNSGFTLRQIIGNILYSKGKISLIGYNVRKDEDNNENIYTSHFVQIDAAGNITKNMIIKPKIGNCTWFGSKGMNSGNIERRCHINEFFISENKLYLQYSGIQGGSSFWQCVSIEGNLIEPYRQVFRFDGGGNYYQNVLGSDRYLARYSIASGNTYRIALYNMLTSQPIGTHTRLAQAIEKTEANTMKVQYLFEIDLPIYGEDYF